MSTDEYVDPYYGRAREYVQELSPEDFRQYRLGVAMAVLIDLANDLDHEHAAIARLMLRCVVEHGSDSVSSCTKRRLDLITAQHN